MWDSGVCTPWEIEKAMDMEIFVVKIFSALVYGGIKGCTFLSGPFKKV